MNIQKFSPIPFGQDSWITSVISSMCYIIYLICFCFFYIHTTTSHWQESYLSKIIIQLPIHNTDLAIKEKTIAILKEDEGVKNCKIIDKSVMENISKLLASPSLPKIEVPVFIQAETYPNKFSFKRLEHKLKEINPEINILDTNDISSKFFKNIKILETVFFLLCLLILSISILVIIILVRFEVTIHKDIIHILYLLGAQENYISNCFQRRGRIFGIKSGLIGTALGGLTYLAFVFFYNLENDSLFSFFIAFSIFLPFATMIFCDILSKLSSRHLVMNLQQNGY